MSCILIPFIKLWMRKTIDQLFCNVSFMSFRCGDIETIRKYTRSFDHSITARPSVIHSPQHWLYRSSPFAPAYNNLSTNWFIAVLVVTFFIATNNQILAGKCVWKFTNPSFAMWPCNIDRKIWIHFAPIKCAI